MRWTMRAADSRTVHTWDGLVLFWAVLWAVVGVWTGVALWHASSAGDTISSSGRAIHTVGTSLAGLADIPVVGDKPGEIGSQAAQTGLAIADRGQAVKGQLRQLAILLGIAIVAIPVSPVLGVYLPFRLARRREIEGIRRGLGRRGLDPALEEYLANRARGNLPFDVVEPILAGDGAGPSAGAGGGAGAGDGGGDVRRRLAEAELARLGIAG